MEREPKRPRRSRLLLRTRKHWIAAAHAEQAYVLEWRSSGAGLAMTNQRVSPALIVPGRVMLVYRTVREIEVSVVPPCPGRAHFCFGMLTMMMRGRYAIWLLLPTLLCTSCAPEAPAPKPTGEAVAAVAAPALVPAPFPKDPPLPVAPAPVPDITGWWSRPETLVNLGLTAAEGNAMAVELTKFEKSYQTAQRQLRTVRRTQIQMLEDPRIPSADIRRFNQRNLQTLLTSMLDQNIAARLWVREHLSSDQSARVLARSPRFYAMRWFRAAPVPAADSLRAVPASNH